MADYLFYIFGGLMLVCAFLVVAPFTRNPVNSAMFLVLTLLSMAGLFVLLEAFFIAAIQILVYAGAVMVVFLFVIMLMDLKAEARRRFSRFAVAAAAVAAFAFAVLLLGSAVRSAMPHSDAPGLQGSAGSLGKLLFAEYLLPFEIVSLILLVAMVGVILLSKGN